MQLRTILCPIDFSDVSARELDVAVEVARAFDARLVLHHNRSTVAPGLTRQWEWDAMHRDEAYTDADAERRMQGVLGSLPSTVRPEGVVSVGPLGPLLLTLAVTIPTPLDAVADPTDASYVPRPEWYFLSLFQLLKYFPGALEPVATIVIPGLVVAALMALPFLDRRPERHPLKRPLVSGAFAVVGIGIISLTWLGLKDSPREEPEEWSPLAIAGREFARDERCTSCHRPGGLANVLDETRMRKEPQWVLSHVRDPEVIAPGLRPPPRGGMSEAQAQSLLSFMQEATAGEPAPAVSSAIRLASLTLGRYCATCHMIDGEGGNSAPDLTRAA